MNDNSSPAIQNKLTLLRILANKQLYPKRSIRAGFVYGFNFDFIPILVISAVKCIAVGEIVIVPPYKVARVAFFSIKEAAQQHVIQIEAKFLFQR
jgi:hypothetical protein